MEDISGSSAPLSLTGPRYTDDRASSDSGISSRGGSSSSSSAGSGSSDERSGSRSSVLSSLDEGVPSHHYTASSLSRRSPNALAGGGAFYHPNATLDGVRVWRDPSLLLVTDRSVRHIDSVQHQSLLMSHPAVAAGSPSSSAASVVSPASAVAAPSTPAHYPPAVMPMITPHPLHHALPPPGIYTAQIPDMLWKQRFPISPAHLHTADDIMERERAYHDKERQDRFHREREQEREVEKYKEKEREKQRQEKDRLEKQKAEQAVSEHFTESLKLASQKQQQQQLQRSSWNLITLPPPPASVAHSIRVSEEERKRMIEEHSRLIKQDPRDRAEKIAPLGTYPPYAPHNVPIPKSVSSSSKNDYLSNVAAGVSITQGRGGNTGAGSKSTMLPKSESGYNMYGYPAYQPPLNFIPPSSQSQQDKHKNVGIPMNSMSGKERDMGRGGGPIDMMIQHASDLKSSSSVIVKNEGGKHAGPPMLTPQTTHHHLLASDAVSKTVSVPTHSSSPKSRQQLGGEPHYLGGPQQTSAIKSQHEYHHRSPNQSPLQAAAYAAATSPHQQSQQQHHHQQLHMLHGDPTKLHHRQAAAMMPTSSAGAPNTPTSAAHRHSPLPPHQLGPPASHRQSPHHRQSPLPPPPGSTQQASPLPHHRHSPHASLPPTASPPERHMSAAAGVSLYQKALAGGPPAGYAYGVPSSVAAAGPMHSHGALSSPSQQQQHHHHQQQQQQQQLQQSAAAAKSKVGSPAPHHIYGKPSSGITSGTPVCRAQEISLSPVIPTAAKGLVTPSPYQQLSQHQLPPSTTASPATNASPPPAHSSQPNRPVSVYNTFRLAPPVVSTPVMRNSPVSSAVSDLSMSVSAAVVASQTQPLDLGTKELSPMPSPFAATELIKRKWPSEEYADDEAAVAKRMCSGAPSADEEPTTFRLAAVAPTPREASPTTVINVAATPPPPSLTLAETIPTSATLPDENTAPHQLQPQQPLPPQLPPPAPCGSPTTTPARGAVDGEKSNSPKPPSYGGHKLKKAWLQRHSGEDVNEDRTCGVRTASSNGSLSISDNSNTCSADGTNVPSASSTTRSNSPSVAVTAKEGADSCANSALTSLNNSINSIGSMAVNSISKTKPAKGAGGKKTAAKDRASPVVLNGHVSPKDASTTAPAATAAAASDDTSSSEAESATNSKSSPKRVPPKVKRKKYPANRGAAVNKTSTPSETEEAPKRRKLNSTSDTDSDKESASESKDSDNSSTGGVAGKKTSSGGRSGAGGGDDKKDSSRKRGRRPKVSGSYSPAGNKQESTSSTGNAGASNAAAGGGNGGDSPKEKKFRRDDAKDRKDPFAKPSIGQLKKTGDSFLQDGPCHEVAPKLAKCRECRMTQYQRSRSNANIFCRFYAFRRLRYTKNGQLAIAGFSDPHKDATQEDLSLWLPNYNKPPTDLDLEMARFMLAQVGDQFCELLTQEAEAINIHISEDKKIAWKRVVPGIREMCDVCETTLFNFHWVCSKCGFVVCIDCYKGRKNGTIKIWGEAGKDRDDLSWLLCTNRQAHEQEKLMLTQIIAGDSLVKLTKLAHETRAMWDVAMYCGCPLSQNAAPSNGICKEIMRNFKQEKQRKAEQVNGQVKTENGDETKKNENDSPLNWLADVALNQNKASVDDDCDSSSDSDDGNYSTLRELLVRPNKTNGSGSQPNSPAPSQSSGSSTNNATATAAATSSATATAANKPKQKKTQLDNLDEVISNVGGNNGDNADDYLSDRFLNGSNNSVELKYFVRTFNKPIRGRDNISIRIMTLSESKLLYPNVPHSWLCDGKLLRLLDSDHPGNYIIFQDQWKRGQPVIVSDVTKRLDLNLWHPDSFAKDFGDIKNDLINCMTGKTVPNQPMRKFWEGFEYQSRRLKDDKGNGMLLKLKDWPPGEDFAEMLPTRFNDLMSVLPLGDYTQRNGKLNLASRLPESFVRPDLGPKMYNAYGSAMFPDKGTTNLHLDISDAVNVMVYVGIPKDGDTEKYMKEAYRAIDEAGCDFLSRRRARERENLPGALWHIYTARDADKIRDLLNKVAIERGARLEPNHDPIHDQSWYLDGPLRERLKKEYSVEGYAIVQCLGDAVFVPAGTPHQVRNLLNCIKIAEDFVSPENVPHCFHLTQEFRDLSDTHSNHEDKLQIKNIMYHAVKDSLSVLGATLKSEKSRATDGAADGESADDADVKTEPESSS